ncbi:hypothetical protein D210916BOD24_27940 [Alteromonas sp. D210916BOD_24]|uniref:hypothetical protein n=1 Tax=Alteromonas sp. D210916BOD_24 TaxID=3157618 RepID=UPI00399CC4EC
MPFKFIFLYLLLFVIGLLSSSATARDATVENTEPAYQVQTNDVLAYVLGKAITLDSVMPQESERVEMRNNARDNYAGLLAYRIQITATNDIISLLREDYAQQKKIVVDEALQRAFVEKFGEEFNAKQPQSHHKTIQQIAHDEVLKYATEKAMYEEFGGRVVFTQSNPQMPVDAYNTLLTRYKDAGQLNIVDEELNRAFWAIFSESVPFKYVIPNENINYDHPWWL